MRELLKELDKKLQISDEVECEQQERVETEDAKEESCDDPVEILIQAADQAFSLG